MFSSENSDKKETTIKNEILRNSNKINCRDTKITSFFKDTEKKIYNTKKKMIPLNNQCLENKIDKLKKKKKLNKNFISIDGKIIEKEIFLKKYKIFEEEKNHYKVNKKSIKKKNQNFFVNYINKFKKNNEGDFFEKNDKNIFKEIKGLKEKDCDNNCEYFEIEKEINFENKNENDKFSSIEKINNSNENSKANFFKTIFGKKNSNYDKIENSEEFDTDIEEINLNEKRESLKQTIFSKKYKIFNKKEKNLKKVENRKTEKNDKLIKNIIIKRKINEIEKKIENEIYLSINLKNKLKEIQYINKNEELLLESKKEIHKKYLISMNKRILNFEKIKEKNKNFENGNSFMKKNFEDQIKKFEIQNPKLFLVIKKLKLKKKIHEINKINFYENKKEYIYLKNLQKKYFLEFLEKKMKMIYKNEIKSRNLFEKNIVDFIKKQNSKNPTIQNLLNQIGKIEFIKNMKFLI